MAARNMFIEIYEYPYKFMTFARMLERPHGGDGCRRQPLIADRSGSGDRPYGFMSKFTKN